LLALQVGRVAHVLRGIDLTVPTRSCFGFLGPNGAGKTTTIKTIMGLIFPTNGSVLLLGKPPTSAATRVNVGYLPENPSFHDHLTGREALRFSCALLKMPKSTHAERTEAVLDLVKIRYAGDLQVRRYSKGMTQRLGIAQALLHNPELVILDEPMSGLDPLGRRDVKDLIVQLHSKGHTVFFSTHIISDVEEICDHVAIVVGGKVTRAGPVAEMLAKEQQDYEIVARKVPADFPNTGELRGREVTTFVRQNEALTQELVKSLWAAGAEVLSMTMRRSGLETVFLGEVAKQPPRRAEE
ncbi:MAG: ABC transporter ATP-binding protein, partial [Thaumarchaeota archaeon]|nr:ABC transporter ATP-binding protein [Nitrososphaerota archaeon]